MDKLCISIKIIIIHKCIAYPSKRTVYSTVAKTFYSKFQLVIKLGKKSSIL